VNKGKKRSINEDTKVEKLRDLELDKINKQRKKRPLQHCSPKWNKPFPPNPLDQEYEHI
jgi:hypothetical protein